MTTEKVAAHVAAEYIERHAETLVESWITWVRQRVPTGPATALPERALRNHVPPVLRSLGRYVREPIQLAREELLGHLRLHAQVRRDQGYALQEVLAELDGLADLVTRAVNRVLKRNAGDAPADELVAVACRVATGLRAIAFITVGTYDESAAERARAYSAGLEDFARAVAHELRNPLHTLSMTVEMLRDRLTGDDVHAHLDVMDSAIQRAAALADTIQTLAVVEGARTVGQLVGLTEAVERVVREFADEARGGEVEVRVARPLPDVLAEATLVYIVLANLVGNGIKYRDPDKGQRWVEISAERIEEPHDSGFLRVVVQDNGLGIPPEFTPRVFQRGFRAHPDRAQGTGLGLHLVQQAVHSRGGEVDLESEEGEGTTVRALIRCLDANSSTLATDQFSVEALMGRKVVDSSAHVSGPELPDEEE